jgi:hypothetical protein
VVDGRQDKKEEKSMRMIAHALVIAAMALPTTKQMVSQTSQLERSGTEWAQPVRLEVAPGEDGSLSYRIAGKDYSGYPLDELRKRLSGCKAPRPLYVLIDYRVPTGQIPGTAAPKLQVDNVRYFIRYPELSHSIVEIKIVGSESKLP